MDREDADFGRGILDVGADFNRADSMTVLSRFRHREADHELVVYCSTENYDRTRQMLVDMYVQLGVSREAATLHYFGPPKPPPRRPDPLQVATAFDEVTAYEAHEALSKMGLALAESVRVMSGVSTSVCYAIEELNRQLIEGPNDCWSRLKHEQIILAETRSISKIDFDRFRETMMEFSYNPGVPHPRRRAKKKRGHNHDRDRVIGGKAGYC